MGCAGSVQSTFQIAEAISRTPLVLTYDSEQIEELSSLLTLKAYRKGQKIISSKAFPKDAFVLINVDRVSYSEYSSYLFDYQPSLGQSYVKGWRESC